MTTVRVRTRTFGLLTAFAVVLAVAGLNTGTASADTAPADSSEPVTASADPLPTAQMDGVAWSQTVIGDTVYVGGEFANARPAGSAPGTNQVARKNLLAYNITTGELVDSFAPAANGKVLATAASPDGSRLYVGGLFTNINGVNRYRIAALNPQTGAVITQFNAGTDYVVKSIVATNDTVYVGGSFKSANGNARTNLAAFRASDGAVTTWAPVAAGGQVLAMTLTPDGSKLVVGGQFTSLNGNTGFYGLGAVDAATGANTAWAASNDVKNAGSTAAINSLTTDGTRVYGSGYTFGPGNLEGFFAADPTSGAITAMEDCHGDTYSVFPNQGSVVTVGHAHFCGNVRGFPQNSPWSFQRALAFTAEPDGVVSPNSTGGYTNWGGRPAAALQHWFPELMPGTVTGQTQAAWHVTGNDDYVVMGGEFPTVNGVAQQGLVRFGKGDTAPKKWAPEIKGFYGAPKVQSFTAGTARVTWLANWDRDNENLHYRVLRDGRLVWETDESSTFWRRPVLGFTDSGLEPGREYRYTIETVDPDGNAVRSDPTYMTVAVAGDLSTYAQAVLADNPSNYWRMGEASGAALTDAAGWMDATTAGAVTRGITGAVVGDANKAVRFNGTSSQTSYSNTVQQAPDTFSAEAWFRTNSSASAGKIIGFGSSKSGGSGSYDRHVYMRGDGKLVFGVFANEARTVVTNGSFNDNTWHHVVATFGDGGQRLMVDGKLVAQNRGSTNASSYVGYWRVGGDNLNGWPNRPGSDYFNGEIDEVAIYHKELSVEQANNHFVASGRASGTPAAPNDTYGAAVYSADPLLYWRLNETSGTTAADSSRNAVAGVFAGNPTLAQPGQVSGGTAVKFGATGQTAATAINFGNPRQYSTEAWFKTTTTQGGVLVGFGNAATGLSANADRQVTMLNDGRLRFSAGAAGTPTVESAGSFNDGAWHHVVATQNSKGMKLFVDQDLVGSNTQANPRDFAGYWRIGGDNAGGASASNWFDGVLDEVAIYDRALLASEVTQHFTKGGGQLPNQAPTADFSSDVDDLAVAFDAGASSDPDGSLVSYDWDFGDGATGTGKNANHEYASGDTYSVTLTVTDDRGDSATKTRDVTVAANEGPTAQFSSQASDLDVSVDAGGSTDPDGSIASFEWEFGDGDTATGPTATHHFATAGTYAVTLTVTDDDGVSDSVSKDVTVTEPAFFAADTFGRTVANGWGSAVTGGLWSVTGSAANYSVGSGEGAMRAASAGATSTAFLGGVSQVNTDLRSTIALNKAQTGGGSYVSIIGRRVNSTNDYRAKLRFLATGELNVSLSRTLSGTEATLVGGKLAGFTYQPGEKLNVRLLVTGTNATSLKVKVWRAGTAEPGTWTYSGTDSSAALQAPGSLGAALYLSGSSTNAPMTLSLDDLTAGIPNG